MAEEQDTKTEDINVNMQKKMPPYVLQKHICEKKIHNHLNAYEEDKKKEESNIWRWDGKIVGRHIDKIVAAEEEAKKEGRRKKKNGNR